MTNEPLVLNGKNKTEVALGSYSSYSVQNKYSLPLYYRESGSADGVSGFIKHKDKEEFDSDYEFWYKSAGDDDTFTNFVNRDNTLEIVMDYNEAIARGMVNGKQDFDLYGRNPRIDTGTVPEDVWNGSGLYTGFPDVAETLEIYSTDDNDTILGTGARTVVISNLLNFEGESMPDITVDLDGQNLVSLGSETYYRASTMEVIDAGSNGSNEGNIILRHSTTNTNVFAVMPGGNNYTAIMAGTVPLGKTAFFNAMDINMSRTSGSPGSANVAIFIKKHGGLFTSRRDVEITHSNGYSFHGKSYIQLPERTDFVVRVKDVSDNITSVSAEARAILVDN